MKFFLVIQSGRSRSLQYLVVLVWFLAGRGPIVCLGDVPTPTPAPLPLAARTVFAFDTLPKRAIRTASTISEYEESDFMFKPEGAIDTEPPYRLTRNGGGFPGYPDDLSNFLQLAYGDSLEIYGEQGEIFRAVSIDLAEYSTVFAYPETVGFVGTKVDGSQVTATFVTDGVIDGNGPLADFQTFYFPSTFDDLVKIEATTVTFSLDNLVLDSPTGFAVPSPTPQPTLSPGASDHTSPTVSIVGPALRHTRLRSITLKGSASDDQSVQWIEIRTGTGPFVHVGGGGTLWRKVLALKSGRNIFSIRAIDAAGNVSDTRRVVVIRDHS